MDQFISVISVIGFTIFGVAMTLLGAIFLQRWENRRKVQFKKNFKEFSLKNNLTFRDLRAVPRVLIPENLDVTLSFVGAKYSAQKAHVMDVSLSGFATRLSFGARKISLNEEFNDVVVETPINNFTVKRLKSIRIEPQMEKRVMAFQITKIDEDQFAELKTFMAHLNKFLETENGM
jgi:hypothetical protein